MFNYKKLCDYEFEILCKDIMQKKLGVPLQIFARGRDGGIDITDDTVSKNVVIQVKHYINSKYSDLISSLKKEVSKVAELKPEKYYVCCALELTPANKTEIFNLFAEYMEGSCNILSLNDIDGYLQDSAAFSERQWHSLEASLMKSLPEFWIFCSAFHRRFCL